MERRTFIKQSSLVGIASSMGLGFWTSILSPYPSFVFPESLKSGERKHINEVAKQIQDGLEGSDYINRQLTRDFLEPVRVLKEERDLSNYKIVYQNKYGQFVELHKVKGVNNTRFFTEDKEGEYA
ncbi:MAG: hypothetical protein ACPG5P_02330 [Saprospiraceae bacterium]